MKKMGDMLTRIRQGIEQRTEDAIPRNGGGLSDADPSGSARWGMWALGLGGIFFLTWAALAPLSQGVPAHGFVKVEGNRKTIQHLRGGVIEAILVREGDNVVAEQPLLRLNEAQVQAQQGSIDSQLITLLAVEARLNAERAGKKQLVFPEFLTRRKDDLRVKEAIQVQKQLFVTREVSLDGEMAIANESIAGLNEQIRGLQAQEKAKDEQIKLFRAELDALKPLFDQGFVPRNRMFELERAIAYLSGQRSEDLSNIGRARTQIAEVRLKMLNAQTTFRKEVETQLTDIQRQVADLKERRVATQDDIDRIVLKAPVAGTVVDLSVHTVGGVITPGQKLMDIVPTKGHLVVEVQIPPHLIDGVHAGQQADLHFTAFDQTIVPTVPGELTYVSADRITDPRTDQSYFIGRIQVTPAGLQKLGNLSLQAGMPAEAVIKTGERSLMGYLLKPLLVRLQFAFTER